MKSGILRLPNKRLEPTLLALGALAIRGLIKRWLPCPRLAKCCRRFDRTATDNHHDGNPAELLICHWRLAAPGGSVRIFVGGLVPVTVSWS
ncbi:hypothetical protein [Streptomyces mirabilis]|uniref:hypothetical protein n=1 Tax=Streptomyces mirabilis TaxID=68239 RepID=UPI0036A40A48